MNKGSIIRKVSDYIAGASSVSLPAEVSVKAKHHILDTIGAMVSGSKLPPGHLAIEYIRAQGGTPEAQVIGSSLVTTAVNAALANAIMAHSDETDDSHAPSSTHPGCAIVPAALAMAERQGSSGAEFLQAVVVGYDIGCRVTRALGPQYLSSKGLSSHSIGGTFGAAAAAARLANFSPPQVTYALSYAAQQASGIKAWLQSDDHIEKAFDFAGMPSRNGTTAVTLVQAGFTGVADVFEGERNFLQAYSADPNPGELVRGLGAEFEIMRTNIKKYCVGSAIQAPLDALLQIIAEHSLTADQVDSLIAHVPENGGSIVNDRNMPDVSLQYILSAALLDGELTFAAAHSFERMSDPRILDVKSRIRLHLDPELTHARPRRQGIVEVFTKDGRTLKKHVVGVRGTAANPMATSEVEEKARDLIASIVGKDRCNSLFLMVENVEKLGDIRELRSVLAR
ncbi:MAG: MmgE/PrpD family protein [Candidatus Binatia bacterium]